MAFSGKPPDAFIKGSTSRTCYAKDCGNSDYQLRQWSQKQCTVHNVPMGECQCEKPPFELFTFPTEKRNPGDRQIWLKNLNRAVGDRTVKFHEPSQSQRVCSLHFVDGKKTIPTLNLGHKRKVTGLNVESPRDKRAKGRAAASTTRLTSVKPETFENEQPPPESAPVQNRVWTILYRFLLSIILSSLRKCREENKRLKAENTVLRQTICKLKTPKGSHASELLKNDHDVNTFTGIKSLSLFHKLLNYVSPFVRKRWKGAKYLSTKVRKFTCSPKKFGPKRKLKAEDEFLLCLMKLRLGLIYEDLAKRFSISISLCNQIFNSWLTAMSKTIGALVFWPSPEQVSATLPKRFQNMSQLRVIIDCSEIFIETPKDSILQNETWSNYKHHNTAKFLIGVAANSTITFLSKAYGGRESDKAIVNVSGMLDKCDPYDIVMADKGFNILDECVARRIRLEIPPGKRGKSQMSDADVAKTKKIANRRILVEQVIRRLKSFRILRSQLPISLLGSIDKMILVCSGLVNLMDPIYRT